MRARMALWISGTTCELREVKLADKPDAMLAASSKGTVPVVVMPDGAVIDEEYLISSINVVADTDCTPFVQELIHTAATGALTGRGTGRQGNEKTPGPAV